MNQFATKNAKVEPLENGFHLEIQNGDSLRYCDAQLDDYSRLPRNKFPHHSLTFSLSARASASSLPGTWGFGLWNDPFGFSLGFGGNPFRTPALPNTAWFFFASPENYLSFADKPANGFIAQSFSSPKIHPLLLMAGLTFPFSRRKSRELLSRIIHEDSCHISVDVAQWHRYSLKWSPMRVVWDVDSASVFESPVSPNHPLGMIIWIDNQFAAFTPDGKISAGVLPHGAQWLEVCDIQTSVI
jgi:hypothetical protein